MDRSIFSHVNASRHEEITSTITKAYKHTLDFESDFPIEAHFDIFLNIKHYNLLLSFKNGNA